MTFRTRFSLDGVWQFRVDTEMSLNQPDLAGLDGWRQAQVPLPWQAQFDDLRLTAGVAWYRKEIVLDAQPPEAAILHFGAVDYHATVWLNDQMVGEHEGGYLPFEFEVGHLLRAGRNRLEIRVADPGNDRADWPDYRFNEIPHGKQSWYGPISGIWQSVWLETRHRQHIRDLHLTPAVADGAIKIVVDLGGADVPGLSIEASVYDAQGDLVTELERGPADRPLSVQLNKDEIALWSPDSPALYTVSVRLVLEDQVVDGCSATCGFRTVEARDGRIYLNGEPVYLRGVLDQAYYPETIYTPPSLEFLEEQLLKAKALGLNCLRCHIKIEDPRYYEVADRLGMLIWTEIPNWIHLSPEARARAKETFALMVNRDWNHPSIIAWTLINENWGTDLAYNEEHRRWLRDFCHEAAALDPTRLIVDNSACQGNLHVAGDIEDFHDYRAIPDHADDWDNWVADFAQRPAWSWAEDYAAERRSDLPLIVSEFGNWGLPDPDALAEQGKEPWWFETGHDWGDGIVYPHAMKQRYEAAGLDRVFGYFEDFVRMSQEHMARSLAYEISTMRLHPEIGGYVITEFTDVHWECNGLLDMQRNLKQGLNRFFTPLNQDRCIVLRPQHWSGRPGELLPVEIHCYDVDGAAADGTLRWQTASASGELPCPGGVVPVPLPSGKASGLDILRVEWITDSGEVAASNEIELAYVIPDIQQETLQVIDAPELAAVLSELGYLVVEGDKPEPGATLVANRPSTELAAAVRDGARLLLILGPEAAKSDRSGLPLGAVIPRAGTLWQGDWATSFSWIKKQGPFAMLPGDPLLEMEYAAIMPDAVIAGLNSWQLSEHSWAGLALGWIHKLAALITAAPYGKGSLVATTFELKPATLRGNVIAQAMFSGLIRLASE